MVMSSVASNVDWTPALIPSNIGHNVGKLHSFRVEEPAISMEKKAFPLVDLRNSIRKKIAAFI